MREFLLALREDRAVTDPASPDSRLVGRTYAIPFEQVWNAAAALANVLFNLDEVTTRE